MSAHDPGRTVGDDPEQDVQITPTSTSPADHEHPGQRLRLAVLSSDNVPGPRLVAGGIGAFGAKATVTSVRATTHSASRSGPVRERAREGGGLDRRGDVESDATSFDTEAQQLIRGNPDGWVIIDFPETFEKMGPALVRAGGWAPRRRS